jgi:hypothetical protein
VPVTGEETEQISPPIGTGTHDGAYWYCINRYHWGIISADKRDKRRHRV